MIFRTDCNAENAFPVHVHEAGHVVLALALGIEVESVSIAVDLKSPHPFGRTLLGRAFSAAILGDQVTREDATLAAMFWVGGGVYEDLIPLYDAQRIDDPNPPDRSKATGPGDDVYEAYRFAEMLGGLDLASNTLASLMARALSILRRNRAPAAALASELRRVGTLSGARVRALWDENGGVPEARVETCRGRLSRGRSRS